MATNLPLNARYGVTVGLTQSLVVDANGNIAAANVSVSGTSFLTSVNVLGNVSISGTATAVTPSITSNDGTIATTAFAAPRTSATGSLVLPTGTSAQRDTTPQVGYTRYNSELHRLEAYNGTYWLGAGGGGGGATGGGTDTVFYENQTTVTTSYTLTAGSNAVSVGPITIATGASVTIPPGQRWVIL